MSNPIPREFNFLAYLNQPWGTMFGGFQEAVGLSFGTVAEYRAGSSGILHPIRLPGIHNVGDVTLKRGVVNASDLWNWVVAARGAGASARRNVIVSLQNESGNPVQSWKLVNAALTKYTGPALGGTGSDAAIEELVLSAERIEWVPPH